MIAVWPAALPQTPARGGFAGGPRDERAAFQPDVGPPIERRQVTAESALFRARFPQMSASQVAAWEVFARDTLEAGTQPFAWRHPVTQAAWAWRIAKTGETLYDLEAAGARLSSLSLALWRLPGPPWWQPYATATGDLRLPWAVADYEAGVFGVDLSRTAAAAVALVAGTFDVWTTATAGAGGATTIESAHVVVAGDIPATQPANVARIVAYIP